MQGTLSKMTSEIGDPVSYAIPLGEERLAVNELLAPGNRWRGVVAAFVAGVLAMPFIVNGDYRVTADASLEGAIRRVVAAPVDGFVAEAPARAGDVIDTTLDCCKPLGQGPDPAGRASQPDGPAPVGGSH